MGKDLSCIEGACEIEIARNIGARYVITGSVVNISGVLNLSLKLHDADSAALLSSRSIRNKDPVLLLEQTLEESIVLLEDGIPDLLLKRPTKSQEGPLKNEDIKSIEHQPKPPKAKYTREQQILKPIKRGRHLPGCSNTYFGLTIIGWCTRGDLYAYTDMGWILFSHIDKNLYGLAQFSYFSVVGKNYLILNNLIIHVIIF